MSLNSMFNRAAQSILESDRNKSAEAGGQKYPHVQFVEVEGGEDTAPFVVAKYGVGEGALKAEFPILGKSLIRPEGRSMAPADMHDAVLAAFIGAAADLAVVMAAQAAKQAAN